MSIRDFPFTAKRLPATLDGDGSPSSLTAALEAAQVQIAGLRNASAHAYDRMVQDIQITGQDLLPEATRDKWHNLFVGPHLLSVQALHDRLSNYHVKLQHLPEILPAWSLAVARLARLVAQLEEMIHELENRAESIFDAEVARRRAAGLPVGDWYDADPLPDPA